MKRNLITLVSMFVICSCWIITGAYSQCGNLYIAGVVDGPLGGGTPKAVQVCASGAIADLSIYGLGSATNGGGTDGEEFTFPADALASGDCVWVSSETDEFTNFFGFAPCYVGGSSVSINGDDAIELFCSGAVEDTFGDINTDGTGQTWEYTDGWAVSTDAAASGATFDSNWSYSGTGALNGATDNATAANGYPSPGSCPGSCLVAMTSFEFGPCGGASDEEYSITLTVTITGGSGSWTAVDAVTDEVYGGPYNTTGGVLGPFTAGCTDDLPEIDIIDPNDPTCSITLDFPALTCPCQCTIQIDQAAVVTPCDSGADDEDPTDDTYEVCVTATVFNGSGAFVITDGTNTWPMTPMMSVPNMMEGCAGPFAADGMATSGLLMIQDASDSGCSVSVGNYGPVNSCSCADFGLTAAATCIDGTGAYASQDNYFITVSVTNTSLAFPITVDVGGSPYTITNMTDVIYHPMTHTGNTSGGGAYTTVTVTSGDCTEVVNVAEVLCGYLVDPDGNSDGTSDNQLNGSGPWCDCETAPDGVNGGYILAQGDPTLLGDPSELTQLYVLVDAMGTIIGYNYTGLFGGLIDGTYTVHAFNYFTTDDATITGSIVSGETNISVIMGAVGGLICSASCDATYTLSCSCLSCPEIGFVQAPTSVCSDTPFDLEINGLVDFAQANNAEADFGLEVNVFPGGTPADPYTGGTLVGTVAHSDLTGSSPQFASFPMVGAMLGAGTYTLCAILSPESMDTDCRPSACTTIEVVTAPSDPIIDNPVIMVCESGDQTITLSQNSGGTAFDVLWSFDGEVETGLASDNMLVTAMNATGGSSFPAGASSMDSYSASGWTAIDEADAFMNGPNYEFCITAPPGQNLSINSFDLFTYRSGTGPTDYAVYCGNSQVGIGMPPPTWAGVPDSYTTSIAVPAGTQKCFQVYAWGASSGGGTFRVDEVAINGTAVSTAPTLYNFYDADPALGGNLLAGGVPSYDPNLTAAQTPTTIWVTSINGGCESDAVSVILDLEGDSVLACNDNVHISVGYNCEVEILPDMVIEGSSVLNSEIVITDADGNVVPNTLSGEHIGQTFTYQFFSTCSRNSCWGNITIELKNVPGIESTGDCRYNPSVMTPDEITCEITCGGDPWHLITSEAEILAQLEVCNLTEVRYVDETDGRICSDENDGVFHTITWEILLVVHDEETWVPVLTEAYWERPIPVYSVFCPSSVEEFMALPLDVDLIESITGSGAADPSNIINNWMVTEGELEWECAWGSYEPDAIAEFFDNPYTTEHGTKFSHMMEGVIFAYPWFAQDLNNNGSIDSWGEFIPIIPGQGEICNLISSYRDTEFPSCGGAKSILRIWTILDECSGELYQCEQRIDLVDKTGPKFHKHESKAPITFSTSAHTCDAIFEIPPLEHDVKDECSDVEVTVSISLVGEGAGKRPVIRNIGDIVNLEEGIYTITYIATDECGNVSLLDKILHIVDNNPPVAVCNDALTLSLTPENFNSDESGFGVIKAEDLNAGSHDNLCGEVFFKIIRLEELRGTRHGYWNNLGPNGNVDYSQAPKGPFFPTNPCDDANADDYGNIVELTEKGVEVEITFDQIFFDDETFFCCEDIGKEIEVVLRVFDRDPGSGPVEPYRMDGDISTAAFTGEYVTLLDDEGNPVLDSNGNQIVVFESFDNDLANHYSECTVTVKIEDKIGVVLTCPDDASVSCLDPIDPLDNTALGSASASGLCGEVCVMYNDYYDFTDQACSDGVILRTWYVDEECDSIVSDLESISAQCIQLIQVGGDGKFDPSTIKWPPHYTGETVSGIRRECNFEYDENQGAGVVIGSAIDNIPVLESTTGVSMPSPFECVTDDGICEPEWDEPGCGLIGKTAEIDTVFFEDDACVKILKHWKVIDWCTWEPNSGQDEEDLDDEGDIDDIGNYDEDLDYGPFYGHDQVEAVEDWTPGGCSKEACSNVYYRYVRPFAEDTDNDGSRDKQLYYDPATGETNYDFEGHPVSVVDHDGMYTYTQVIKVINTSEPEIQFCQDIDVPALEGCMGELVIWNRGMDTDDCASAWLKWDVEIFDAAWELIDFYQIEAANGETVEINVAEEDGLDADREAEGLLERGTYRVRWTLSDGCGNSTACVQYYTVRDLLPPTPLCIQDLTTALMDEAGNVTIWASDYNRGSTDNCTDEGDLLYSFSGDEYQPSVTLSCEDFITDGVWESFGLFMYVWDDAGNSDFCEVWLRVDDNFNVCEDLSGEGTGAIIQGDITTEYDDAVENVNVEISASIPEYPTSMVTGREGLFSFATNPMSRDYTITPSRDDNYLNGVSTIDLVLMQKHILGLDPLDSPYKVIAADVNNDGRVSAIDLVELRKLILGLYTELPANTSWKFVDANQIFANPLSPWPIRETIDVNNLSSDMMSEDFIGVKIGDVNGNASANNYANTEIRSSGSISMSILDQEVRKGEVVKMHMTGDQFADVHGYQFTMEHKGLTFTEVVGGSIPVTMDHIGVGKDRLTMSWNHQQGTTSDDRLLTLTFEATEDVKLSEVIRLHSAVTPVEAYVGASLAQKDIDLIFIDDKNEVVQDTEFALFQNEPNPFVNETTIGFVLPKSGSAIISIMDVNGKLIHTYEGDYDKGYNQLAIKSKDIDVNGVLIYQLESNDMIISKKMILMN